MNKPQRPTFEQLLEGRPTICLINEPLEPTALEKATQRWGYAALLGKANG